MLGLRKSFGSGLFSMSTARETSPNDQSVASKKLKKRTSVASSLNSDNNSIDEDNSSHAAMETIRAGLKESISVMTVPTTPIKGVDVVTTVATLDSSSDSEKTVSVKDEVITSTTSLVRKQTSSSIIRISRVTDIYRTIRRNISQLDDYTYTEHYFEGLNIDSYRQYIANERLIRMPRRGSNWDRALRAALMVGENLVDFGDAIRGFCSDTQEASVTGLASCKLLLEVSIPVT